MKSLNKQKVLLSFLITGYLTLAIFYLVTIPTGESPDEPGHLQCVEQVARLHRLPIVDPLPKGTWWSRETTTSGRMCYHMPIYYLTAGAIYWVVHQITNAPLQYEFPPNNPEWGFASKAMFTHEPKSFLSWSGIEPATLISLRLFSIALGGILLLITYHAAQLLFPHEKWIPLASVAFLAGWPQFLYMVRSVSNDILATTFAGLTLIILLRVQDSPTRFIWVTLVSILAVLTKLNMIFILPIVLFFLAHSYLTIPSQRANFIKVFLVCLLLFGLLATVLLYVPPINKHFLISQNSFSTINDRILTLDYWLEFLTLTASSGWARFGWMNLPAPLWQAYTWWIVVTALSSIGLMQLLRYLHGKKNKQVLLIILLWVAGSILAYIQINLNRFQPQFRFLFPLLPILTILMGSGFVRLISYGKVQEILAILGLFLLLFGINLWILIQIVHKVYWV